MACSDLTPAGFYPALNGGADPDAGTQVNSNARGNIIYSRSGWGLPSVETPFYPCSSYGGGLSHDGADFLAQDNGDIVRCFTVGAGTITIHTAEGLGGPSYVVHAKLWNTTLWAGGVGSTPYDETDVVIGSDIVFDVPAVDPECLWWVDIQDGSPSFYGGWGFAGFDWAVVAPPDAQFSWVQTAALTIEFSDESTNSPTSWLWDFGDGHTSTLQNPTHVYATAGTYSVQLTATNGEGSDSVTHSVEALATAPYEPPGPGGAILEIYVSDPASPRWDVANWDEAAWGASGWVDVTPQGIEVRIQWGTTRPELGILAQPEAANWYVTFYDPDRILDPANPDSPYASDLKPGLPIRIRHRGFTVQTGQADVIQHSFQPGAKANGLIRGSDIISKMARAVVPADASLGDTLYDRARDCIAAAGLDISVYTGGFFGPDPDLGAKLTGERTVWAHILDAAQAVLVYPYVTRDARLAFRKFLIPANSGKVVGSPNLIDLNSIVDTAGLYSELHVQDTAAGGLGIITPAITPPPWFGRRVYERLEETPDPEDWADAVLADRSEKSLRWVPGDVYPLTADEVDYFAKIDPGELVTLRMLETAPNVNAMVLVLGGTITATPQANDAVQWRFTYEAASSDTIPIIGASERLTLDGGGSTDYLTTESGSDYLYEDSL